MSNALLLDDLLAQALQHNRAQEKAKWNEGHPDGKVAPYVTDAGKCPVQVWYSINDWPVTNPPGVDSLMNFALGKAAEEAFSSQLEQFGVKLLREVRVEIPWGHVLISGRIDFLLVAQNFIAELKSTSQRQMYKVSKEGGRSEHRSQLMLYLLAGKMGLLEEHGIIPSMCDWGVLAYLVKDATKGRRNRWMYDVAFDYEEAHGIMEELMEKDLLSKQPRPPQKPPGFTYDKFPCSYCDFQDGCWKGWWAK